MDLVIKDGTHLVQFRMVAFLRYLSKLNLKSDDQNVVRLLATYSPLPYPVLASVLNLKISDASGLIVRLIDLALILTTEDGYYRIADPVADAAVKEFGDPTNEQVRELVRALSDYLNGPDLDGPRLELSQVLFMASHIAQDEVTASTVIHLANDLIRLVEKFYHSRRYDEAIKFGYVAISERPRSEDARFYLIRALIQEERWKEAQIQLDEYQKFVPRRNVYFLIGFLKRNMGDPLAAIDAYKEAERLGRRGASISRELARCYYLTHNYDQASRYIRRGLNGQGENRYVDNRFFVDLSVQIATSQRDEPTARQELARLEIIAKPVYYYHRLSRVEFAFGNRPKALTAARQAAESDSDPPFEVLTTLASLTIVMNGYGEAEELLMRIDRRFKNTRPDVRLGIKCRLEIARGRYNEALVQSERITDKNSYFKKIRLDALNGELNHSALTDDLRASYRDESMRLEKEIAGVTVEQLILPESD